MQLRTERGKHETFSRIQQIRCIPTDRCPLAFKQCVYVQCHETMSSEFHSTLLISVLNRNNRYTYIIAQTTNVSEKKFDENI